MTCWGDNFAIRGEEMQNYGSKISRVLTSSAIQQGTKIELINGVNDLRDERLLCRLTDVESELEFMPDILGSLNLWAGAGGRIEDTGIGWAPNPWDAGVRRR